MKIQCDVCEKEEATVFCSADEAALCQDCDRRVHCANKLASKHPRYSLLQPAFKDSPLCDICQERRALLFCQEDRAILCRECDIPIHRANEHTQKHARFLLTGVKLSPSSSSSSSSSTGGPWRQESSSSQKDPGSFASPTFEVDQSCGGQAEEEENQAAVRVGVSMSASSISEYLMETLPGWRVDEFLDCQPYHHHHDSMNNNSTSHGYCKSPDHMLPVPDYDFGSETSSSSSASRDLPILVPQFFTQPHQYQDFSPHNHASQNQAASFVGGAQAPAKARSTKSSSGRGGSYRAQFSQGIDPFL